jgi:hypothetical protein
MLPDIPTIDVSTVDADDSLLTTRAVSTLGKACTLCGARIPAGEPRDVWSWDEGAASVEQVLHAHIDCNAIRLAADFGEWDDGSLVMTLAELRRGDDLSDLDALDLGEHGRAILAEVRATWARWDEEEGGDAR